MRVFDSNGDFHPVVEGASLRRVAVRGAGIAIFASGLSFFVQLAGTIILARLLSPSDFGVVTMVTTISLLLSSFGLNGFTEAILQREKVTHSLVSNLFWINVGVGVCLTIGFASAGPLMALFFHDPLVKKVTEGMSLTIVAGSLPAIHLALLNRAMRFQVVSALSVFARVVSVIVGIILAAAGYGYWALVAGYLAQPLSISLGAWIICRWIPSLPRRVPGTGAAVRFALNVFSHYSFNYFTGNTDNLLVGSQYGAQSLGFYKKAFDLFYLPLSQLMSPIGAVVISTLSRFQRDRGNYQRYFLAGMSFLAFVGMGIGADFTLVGKDMIRFLLGPGWEESGRIFAFFGPGIGVMMLYNTHGWIHLSAGRPERWFRWGIVEFLCTVGLFLVGLSWGPRGIASAWTLSFFVLMVPAFWYAGKPIGLGIKPVFSVIWRFFSASVLAVFCSAWLIHAVRLFVDARGASGAFARIVTHSLVFSGIYLCAVVILHRGIGPIRETGSLIRELLPESFAAALAGTSFSAEAMNQPDAVESRPEAPNGISQPKNSLGVCRDEVRAVSEFESSD